MSLQDVIEETKKQLEKAVNAETVNAETEVAVEETTEEVEQPNEETAAEEPNKETEKAPDKEEPKTEKVEAKTTPTKEESAEFARLRREKQAAERELKALKEKLEGKPEKELAPEEAINQELIDVIQTSRIQKAEKEFAMLESAVFQENPEAEETANAYKAAIYQSIKIQNPRKSHAELLDMTKNTLLMKAGDYVRRGLNPIQELLDEAGSLGIKPQRAEKESEEEEIQPKKADLSKIAANKKRNAGTAGASGNAGGSGQITPAKAATMTSAEWSKLPTAERQRLMRGG
jgi:hypothetical protein